MTTVLVIDDDPALRRTLKLTLESDDFEVCTAANGVDGLQYVEARRPDVIVLDLRMPVMDGATFYRKLRDQQDSTPVIILSAYGARNVGRELGAQACIQKPFDPRDLLETVRRLAGGG